MKYDTHVFGRRKTGCKFYQVVNFFQTRRKTRKSFEPLVKSFSFVGNCFVRVWLHDEPTITSMLAYNNNHKEDEKDGVDLEKDEKSLLLPKNEQQREQMYVVMDSFEFDSKASKEAMASKRPPLWEAIVSGIRLNLIPGLVMIVLATIVVICYYLVPEITELLNKIAEMKHKYGYLFSGISTSVFGGIIPFIFMTLQEKWTEPKVFAQTPQWLIVCRFLHQTPFTIPPSPKQITSRDLLNGLCFCWIRFLFYMLYFCEQGIQVDAMYRLQAHIFGEGTDFLTIAIKVFMDQFVYNVFLASPMNGTLPHTQHLYNSIICKGTIALLLNEILISLLLFCVFLEALLFMWKDCDFSFALLKAQLGWDFFTYRVPVILCSVWLIWIPAVSLTYAMPSTLQIPLYNLVLCFYVLLLTFVNKKAN